MKTLHHSLYLLTLLCTALLFSGCDDDENLFFTQDEVVESDIVTGRQLPLTGNAINIYTTETDVVNVQNAHGNLVAASSDGRVATVVCDAAHGNAVYVTGVTEGKARVTVTDSKGRSAAFTVQVTDVEKAWQLWQEVQVGAPRRCLVEGVSPADSLAIAQEVLQQAREVRYVISRRESFPFSIYRITIYDGAGDRLFEGPVVGHRDGSLVSWKIFSADATLFRTLVLYTGEPQYMSEDLTASYRLEYPSVTKVVLRQPVVSVSSVVPGNLVYSTVGTGLQDMGV